MNTPRKHFAWIRQTAGLFGCEAIMASGKLYIKRDGQIAETHEVKFVRHWPTQRFIELFERVSGTKQVDLWRAK